MEEIPTGISYFFAVAFFLAALVVFFSAGEGITPLSVVLGIAFVMLGGAFIWLAIAQ